MDFIPYWEFDATNNQRRWEDFMSGDWAWEEVVCTGFISIIPTNLVLLGQVYQ